MAYDLILAQVNDGINGLTRSNTSWGFPANTNFHTLLMSYWLCGPANLAGSASSGIWPTFNAAAFFQFTAGTITLSNQTVGSGSHFFQGNFSLPPPAGTLLHLLLSVDTHAQVVQVYINDVNVPVTSPIWTGTPPFDFNVASTINIWKWDVSGVLSGVGFPALADAWISNTPSFVDLSVTANRRKFINADLTPVDLGSTGTIPFGYQPAMYMSIRPGGVGTDILINRGMGGGAWLYTGGVAPTLQATGVCPLPSPPVGKLAMDNVVCDVSSAAAPCELCLDWSNDRGHTFGVPVCQPVNSWGYLTSLQWQRLGMARDRVFRLTWTCADHTALQGAWVTAIAGDEDNEMAGQGRG